MGGQANSLGVGEDPRTRRNPSLTYIILRYIIVNLHYQIVKVYLARDMTWF